MSGTERPTVGKRKQCAKCPWKVSADPHAIPDGYSVDKHRGLAGTIRSGVESMNGAMRIMACHESHPSEETVCVGWLANQLGAGNNLGLRHAVITGAISADFELDGPQHETFAETLPADDEGQADAR